MDVELRASLAKEIRSILKHEKISAVMVTHDQHEAFSMADRIGVINEGSLLQWATAEDLYHSPANRFVARFVGNSNFLNGVVAGNEVDTALGCCFQESLEVDITFTPSVFTAGKRCKHYCRHSQIFN